MLGGSSSINGMAFVRGQAQDFDTWAQMGNQGWTYENVLPFFKRMEAYDGGGDDEFRGRDGPLRVTNPEPRDPLYAALIKAAAQAGIPHNPRLQRRPQDGIAMSQATISSRRRMSTAHCYLDPIRKRPNLHIETGALTQAVLLEGKRCTACGIPSGRPAGGACHARSHYQRRVDQLSAVAGAIGHRPAGAAAGSGDRSASCPAGRRREPARSLCAANTVAVGAKGFTFNDRARGLGLAGQALRYALTGHGLLGMVAAPIRAFVRSREGLEAPDVLLGWVPMLTEPGAKGPKLSRQSGRHLLRTSDAAREQGAHPHHLGRSAHAARDQLQLPVVADRCGAHRTRGPHRARQS